MNSSYPRRRHVFISITYLLTSYYCFTRHRQWSEESTRGKFHPSYFKASPIPPWKFGPVEDDRLVILYKHGYFYPITGQGWPQDPEGCHTPSSAAVPSMQKHPAGVTRCMIQPFQAPVLGPHRSYSPQESEFFSGGWKEMVSRSIFD